jgi:hypothetical protein
MEDTDESLEDSDDEAERIPVQSQKSTSRPMIRPPQTVSEVNGSIGGEKSWAGHKKETAEELEKQKARQRQAEEREMLRRAARRGCAIGLKVGVKSEAVREGPPKGQSRKGKVADVSVNATDDFWPEEKCEAVMNGVVVEASFAKGKWAVRLEGVVRAAK